jgi:hypothetical protein
MKTLLLVVAIGLGMFQANPFGGQTVSTDTMHLTVVASISETAVAKGKNTSLVFTVTPKRDMHVYAPGKHDYQVIAITLDPQPAIKALPTVYPPSEIHEFKELNEKVEVYSKAFTLKRDVTVLALPAGKPNVAITGNVEYQACDEKVCYAPKKVPFKFFVDVK